MGLDVAGLVERMVQDGVFQDLVNNPLVQFGAPTRRYIGAEILPEEASPQGLNFWTETGITYHTTVANDGTPYSPVQIKSGARVGSMKVELGDIDIGSELTAREYDVMVDRLRQDLPDLAEMNVGEWFNTTVNLGLREKMEIQRWQAICDANVPRKTDMGVLDPVVYSNPVGHRVTVASGTVAAPTGLYDPAVDPLITIFNMRNFLRDKGYEVTRIVTSTRIVSLLRNHPKVVARFNGVSVAGAGQIVTTSVDVTTARLNQFLASEGLPVLEEYNLLARTDTGLVRFLRDTALVMICATGRNALIDRGDQEPLITPNILGRTYIGRNSGIADPGITQFVQAFQNDKPPRIEGKGWAKTLPVILDPEAVAVLNYPYPTP